MGNNASAAAVPPGSPSSFASVPAPDKLKVFISSTMTDLRDVREILHSELRDREIDAWVYESNAGARPDSIVESSLQEVQASDIYVGLFWQAFGEVTIQEFQQARASNKPCFIYIRDQLAQRDPRLQDFLEAHILTPGGGVTYNFFDSALALGTRAATDIMAWLVRKHREMTAELAAASISQDEVARLNAEVKRLQATTGQALPRGTSVDYLAQQMRGWFEALGYQFQDHENREDRAVEWLLHVPARRRYDRVLVRGLGVRAEVSDVLDLRRAVDEHRADEGWLVAATWVSDAARQAVLAPENRDLICLTFDELIDQDVDFSHYVSWLKAEVEKRGIDKYYVQLACTKDEFDPETHAKIGTSRYDGRNGWLDGYVDQWIDDPAKEHLSVLGEFGTGKTWLTLHYAWKALQRYEEAKARGIERPRLPLVIPLRDYAKAVSAESLFSEFFFRRHEVQLSGYSAFEQLNRMGKLLLIFDGFDEMASRIDRQQMINNFWELARVVVPGAKAILTCRSEYFPNAQEGRDLLGAQLRASTSALTGEPPQFEVLELEKLDDDQIRAMLSHRAASSSVDAIFGNAEVLDLMRRPVMADLVLESLPEIEAGKPIDLSRVYLYAVRRKMERDIRDERTFTSLADKLFFLCEISWEMLSTNKMTLNYREFPDRLRSIFGDVVVEAKDLDHWHYDMMGQTMLVRNADGDYTPAHRSLAEFFVSYKFAAELGVLSEDFLELARQRTDVDKRQPQIDYKWSSYFTKHGDGEGNLAKVAPLRRFISEDVEKLAVTVGTARLEDVIRRLVRQMVVQDVGFLKSELIPLVLRTSGLTVERSGLVGANAVRVLLDQDASALTGENLRGANLQGCQFVTWDYSLGTDLTGVSLEGCNLEGASFENVRLVDADLTRTKLFGSTGLPYDDLGSFVKVAFSPDGSNIALADAIGGVVVYGLEDKERKPKAIWDSGGIRDHITALSFSPDGRLVAIGRHSGACMICDIHTGECRKVTFGDGVIIDLDFGLSSAELLVAARQSSASFDSQLVMLQLAPNKLRVLVEGLSGQVNYVRRDPQQDGKFVLYLGNGRSVSIGARERRKAILGKIDRVESSYEMFSLAIDAAGKDLVGTGFVRMDLSPAAANRWLPCLAYKAKEGEERVSLIRMMLVDLVKKEIPWMTSWMPRVPALGQSREIMRVSGDGRRIADTISGRLRMWDAAADQPSWTAASHDGGETDLQFSPSGANIATVGSSDGRSLILSDAGETCEVLQTYTKSGNYIGLELRESVGLEKLSLAALRDLGAIS
jgi:hypothetical protein